MNTVLSTRVDEQNIGHSPTGGDQPAVHRRVSLPDRAALHLGLALITWSRRPRVEPAPREHNPNELRERAAARAAREERWNRAMHQNHPWR